MGLYPCCTGYKPTSFNFKPWSGTITGGSPLELGLLRIQPLAYHGMLSKM
jgi:hypothetical protein